MSLIDLLDNDKYLEEFINHKTRNFISKKEINKYQELKENQKFKEIINDIKNNKHKFSIPKKSIINKIGKKKKRLVYQYTKEETYILKYITYLLYEYDYLFSPNLYSFRQNISVKNAIKDLMNNNINNMYGYKVDIENYFNSIDSKMLLKELKKDIKDKKLYNIFKELIIRRF